MSEDDLPIEVNRYDLSERLEVEAKKLQGKKSAHFIDDKSLCSTCKGAQIIRQASKNTRTIYCSDLGRFVPLDISECNSYQSATTLSLNQMTAIAYMIDNRAERKGGYL